MSRVERTVKKRDERVMRMVRKVLGVESIVSSLRKVF